MPTWLSGVIIFEVIFVFAIVWGFMHEEKLIDFEDKIKFFAKRKIRKIKRKLCAKWLSEEGLIVPQKPIAANSKGDISI